MKTKKTISKVNSMPEISLNYSDYIISQFVAKNRKSLTTLLADIRK